MARINIINGARIIINGLDLAEVTNVFVINLIASAIGINNPATLGLLGPFRSWTAPNVRRSRRVKKAIAAKTRTIVIKIIFGEEQ